MALSLASLLGPVSVDRFMREVWDQAPCLCRRSLEPSDVDQLLDLGSFESMLASLHRPDDGWLQLARRGRRELPRQMLCEDGLIDLGALYAAFAGGETLYLTKAERLAPSLMLLCRALEVELTALGIGLRQAVNAHVFLTPPGAQAFPTHRDEHASIVVQLDGAKAWRVHDRTTERPTARHAPCRPGGVDPDALGAEVRSYQLEIGDVLYVPPFWAHDAVAQDTHSLHVTFRVFPMRWSDLLLAVTARHPALDDALPRHALDDPQRLSAGLGAVLAGAAFQDALGPLLAQLAREHTVPRRVLPDDGLRQVLLAGTLTLDTPLVRRAGAACQVFVERDRACISFPGGSIRALAALEDVFRFVAATPRLRARDLPALSAGARYDRLEVARTLVRDGLLRIDRDRALEEAA